MSIAYVTDGTLDGLLTAVHEAFYSREEPEDILPGPPEQPDFTVIYRDISTCQDHAVRVMDAVEKKIGPEAMRSLTLAWLSETRGCGKRILDYLRLGFRTGPQVMSMLAHPQVAPILDAARKVSREQHRLLGLLRFKRLGSGPYLAVMAPDHNQLPLIAPHFASRMGGDPWIIHDERRRLSALCEHGRWCILPGGLPSELGWAEEEAVFQRLWRLYHRTVAIDGRINPVLQRNMMPRRYWKYLVERPDERYRIPAGWNSRGGFMRKPSGRQGIPAERSMP